MSKDKITDYSATAASNTDVGGVSIAEGCNFGNMNNAVREVMSHLAELNAGTYPVADTWSFADPSDLTKKARIDCGSISTSTTRVINMPDGDVTLVAGTMITSSALSSYLALAGGTMTGNITMSGADIAVADNKITRPQIEDYSETVNAIGSIGGGTQDIDLESGNVVTATVDTSTTTFTFSNPPATGKAGSFTLILTNGGSQTVNWPASVDWPGAEAPSLTASGVDVLTFTTTDAGTTWLGFVAGLDMS